MILKVIAMIGQLVPWNVFLLGMLFPFDGYLFAQQPHQVALSWLWSQGSGAPATFFKIQRGTTSGGPYIDIASTPVSNLSFTDLASPTNILNPGQQYCYIIIASNGNTPQDSSLSNEWCGIIPLSISAPTSLSGTAK